MTQRNKPRRVSARAVADAAAAADLDQLQQYIANGVQPTHLATKTLNAVTEAINGEMGGSRAGEERRLRVITLLVKAGCPIEAQTIFRPILNNELNILSYLLAHGADVNQPAPYELFFVAMKGESALNCAVKLAAVEAVRELLAAGADVNKAAGPVFRFGYGVQHHPLWLAVNYNQPEIARLLVEAGADLAAVDPENGTTPLQHAVSHGHPEMTELLLQLGANPTEVTEGDLSLVDQARRNKTAILERLSSAMEGQ